MANANPTLIRSIDGSWAKKSVIERNINLITTALHETNQDNREITDVPLSASGSTTSNKIFIKTKPNVVVYGYQEGSTSWHITVWGVLSDGSEWPIVTYSSTGNIIAPDPIRPAFDYIKIEVVNDDSANDMTKLYVSIGLKP